MLYMPKPDKNYASNGLILGAAIFPGRFRAWTGLENGAERRFGPHISLDGSWM